VFGLVAALACAQPGDHVIMAPGRFDLTEALTVPSGVTLSGAGKDLTVLAHHHDGPAVQAIDAEDVTLCDFAVESDTPFFAPRVTPDDPSMGDVRVEWGLVWIHGGSGARIERLRVRGANGDGSLASSGICCRKTSLRWIKNCVSSAAGRYGIALISAEAEVIEGNDITGSSSGIELRCDDTNGQPSQCLIRKNRCHSNRLFGIALVSSESMGITEN